MLACTLRLQRTCIKLLENFLTNTISTDSMRESLSSMAQHAYSEGTESQFFPHEHPVSLSDSLVASILGFGEKKGVLSPRVEVNNSLLTISLCCPFFNLYMIVVVVGAQV